MTVTDRKGEKRPVLHHVVAGMVSAFMLIACASEPPAPPTAELQAAEMAISQAEQRGVAEKAPLEMKDARDKMVSATEAVNQEKMKTAKRLAEQARVTAEYATAKAEALKAQEVNEELSQGVNTLKQELNNTTTGGQQ